MPNYWRPALDHQAHVTVAVNQLGLCGINEALVEAVGVNGIKFLRNPMCTSQNSSTNAQDTLRSAHCNHLGVLGLRITTEANGLDLHATRCYYDASSGVLLSRNLRGAGPRQTNQTLTGIP